MKRRSGYAPAAAVLLLAIGVFLLFPILSAENDGNFLQRWVRDVVSIMEKGYSPNQGISLQDPLFRYAFLFVLALVFLMVFGGLFFAVVGKLFAGEGETLVNRARQVIRYLYGFLVDAERMISVLRICALFLAVVSFWATAQGMADFVFTEKWQAYLCSLAIQGILLVMSFLLPKFCADSEKRREHLVQILLLAPLTAVVLCISSGFSYIYISRFIYQDSWENESMLLVQNAYREELYGTQEYVERYERFLQTSLNRSLTELYGETEQIRGRQEAQTAAQPDYAKERSTYSGSALQDPMGDVLDAMERALSENAGAQELEAAKETLARTSQMLSGMQETAQNAYARASASYETAQGNLSNAQENLRYARKNGQDTEELQKNVELWTARLSGYADQMDLYLTEQTFLANAADRLSYYQGILEGETAENYHDLESALAGIQKELLSDDPSAEVMIAEITALFEGFEKNVQYGQLTNVLEIRGKLNDFLELLQDYRAVKALAAELKLQYGLAGDFGEVGERIERLKDLIAEVPAQYVQEVSAGEKPYDRMDATGRLNDVIRLYLTEHNAADQAVIYLMSPYRGLGILALILALFLDLASFTAGISAELGCGFGGAWYNERQKEIGR